MAANTGTTREQIELVLLTYHQTGSFRAAGRAAGMSSIKAKQIILDQPVGWRDGMEDDVMPLIRQHVARKCAEVQSVLLRALEDPNKIRRATLKDVALAFAIVTDKLEILTAANKAGYTRDINDLDPLDTPDAVLTAEELRAATKIRAKLLRDEVGR